jgi:HK97 family phage major capsid protein
MTFLTSAASGITPEQYAELIAKPVADASLALDPLIATTITTTSTNLRIPILDEDAAASWVAEGSEITPDDPDLHEITVTPAKVAGLTIISKELAGDSSPEAATIVGEGLARSIAAQVDRAFFANLAAPAPAGLESIAPTYVIEATDRFTNLDSFAMALAAAESNGAQLTAFALNPMDALALAMIKDETGSARPLLGTDATNGTTRQVLGVPLKVTKHVPQGTVWGLPAARIMVVLREDVSLDISDQAYFSSDRVAIRATMRVGFAFPTPLAIAKITLQPDEAE